MDIKYLEEILKKNKFTKRELIQKISEDFGLKYSTILGHLSILITLRVLLNTTDRITLRIKIGN